MGKGQGVRERPGTILTVSTLRHTFLLAGHPGINPEGLDSDQTTTKETANESVPSQTSHSVPALESRRAPKASHFGVSSFWRSRARRTAVKSSPHTRLSPSTMR